MFGRTFFLTTLKALFKEGAAVFDGLAGEGLWQEKPYKVVEILHMSLCAHFSSDEDFRKRLQSYILLTFEPYGFNRQDDVGSRYFWDAFGQWLASCFLSLISRSRLLTRLTAMGFEAK